MRAYGAVDVVFPGPDATGRKQAFRERFHEGFGVLGIGQADGAGEGLKAILSRNGESAARTLGALRRRGIDLGKARSTGLFGVHSSAGSNTELKVARDGILIVVVPGADMSPEAQDTATDIELRITRAAPPTGKRLDILPEPLADPIHDIRIKAATANAYLVRAGEWIQVIDVSGRQCTDFQALAARKVDNRASCKGTAQGSARWSAPPLRPSSRRIRRAQSSAPVSSHADCTRVRSAASISTHSWAGPGNTPTPLELKTSALP